MKSSAIFIDLYALTINRENKLQSWLGGPPVSWLLNQYSENLIHFTHLRNDVINIHIADIFEFIFSNLFFSYFG